MIDWVVFHLVNIIGAPCEAICIFFSSNITDQVHTKAIKSHTPLLSIIMFVKNQLLSTISKCFRRNSGYSYVMMMRYNYYLLLPIHHSEKVEKKFQMYFDSYFF